MCCYFLLQGIFPTQGSNSGLLHCRKTLRQSHRGNSSYEADSTVTSSAGRGSQGTDRLADRQGDTDGKWERPDLNRLCPQAPVTTTSRHWAGTEVLPKVYPEPFSLQAVPFPSSFLGKGEQLHIQAPFGAERPYLAGSQLPGSQHAGQVRNPSLNCVCVCVCTHAHVYRGLVRTASPRARPSPPHLLPNTQTCLGRA